MFILTKPIKPAGDEPFLPLPPYNPTTGESLPGTPLQHILVRPRIRNQEKDIVALLKKMNNAELEKFISTMSDRDLAELMKELLGRIKK